MPKSDLRLAYTTSHIDFDKMKSSLLIKFSFAGVILLIFRVLWDLVSQAV